MGRLTERVVETAKPGRHSDGDGLHLVVSRTGRKKWVLRYQVAGARKDKGLGSYPAVGLKDARQKAAEDRALIAKRIDPIEEQRAAKRAAKSVPTFEEIAKMVIDDAQAETDSPKVRDQWPRYLGPAYCGPLLNRPVHEIKTIDVEAVLRQVWHSKPEAARKFYPAIKRVLEKARVILRDEHGIDIPKNPASWDDLKASGLKPPKHLTRGSHPSLAYGQMPAFMAELREREAVSARAPEFLILTNVRTSAVLKAKWDEFDIAAGIWTVPLNSLKDRRHRKEPLRVPLSPRALEIVMEMHDAHVSQNVFPGYARSKPLSDRALLTLIQRMKWTDPTTGKSITAHGFRATFRTWAEEVATFPHAVIEQAMGHQVGNQVERAYRRTDVLEKRRELMNAWSIYCEPKPTADNVKPFRRPA
jgi:integrase